MFYETEWRSSNIQYYIIKERNRRYPKSIRIEPKNTI